MNTIDQDQLPFQNLFPRNFPLLSYFWIVILIVLIISGSIGYVLGLRISQYETTAVSQLDQQPSLPTVTPLLTGDDGDTDYISVSGTISSDSTYYDHMYVYVDELKNGVKTNQQADTREIFKAQENINYPFSFDRLNPGITYIFTAAACHADKSGYCSSYTQKIKITKCSGQIQATNCIINGSTSNFGNVSFAIRKVDNPADFLKHK